MRSSSITRVIIFILSLGLSILLGTTAIQATMPDPFYWEKIDVDLQLTDSGNLFVTETQTYVFIDKHSDRLSRYIQVDQFSSLSAESFQENFQDIEVTENNQPVANLQLSMLDGQQRISWKHPVINKFPERHTFVLKYQVIGVLERDNPQTKFNWIAISPDLNAPIKAAQVTLHLPAKLSKFTKDFATSGAAVTTKIIDPVTIQFVAKGSTQPQAMLVVRGQFPTKLQSSIDWSWFPVFLICLVIFFLITSYGKAGSIITTILFSIIFLLAGQYGSVLFCILLLIVIIFTDDSDGDGDSDNYNDIG